MANFEVIQSSKVSKEIYCFHYCSIKQRTVCIINVWGYTEILPIVVPNTTKKLPVTNRYKYVKTEQTYRNDFMLPVYM